MRLVVEPKKCVKGEFRPPSDKSLTHRAYMLGAAAESDSLIKMPLAGEDCQATLSCLAQMGMQYTWAGPTDVRLHPIREWMQPAAPLDCGNSGTTMRLLSGLVASRHLDVQMIGDSSLSKRPMKRIAEPLRLMGAIVEGDTPPLRIKGASLRGIDYVSPVASAQIKSCTLLAGLLAEGETWVTEPSLSRDHTERMFTALGVPIRRGILLDNLGVEQFEEDIDFDSQERLSAVDDELIPIGWRCGITGGVRFDGFEFSVPGDISSAAFFMVAAAILPNSRLEILDLSVNPTRTGIIDVFHQVGVPCMMEEERLEMGEPVANLLVACPFERRRPFEISGALVPRLIDEIPILAVLATQCHGESTIRDARELRVKESDRIELVANGLRAMGAEVETFEDGMSIRGPVQLKGARIDANHDHRIAMAFAIAGLAAEGQTIIEGAEAIFTSFPNFENDLLRFTQA